MMVRRPSPRAYVGQWVFLFAVILVGGLLIDTLGANLARRNMQFGFGFLLHQSNFDIPFHLIDWTIYDIYAKALLVSLLNTLLVSAMSIVSATLFGLLVGIMRLSVNWLVRNIALCFVEFVRNTPQLLQIVFWYFAVLQALPPPRQSIQFPGGFLLNVRGFFVPDLIMRAGGSLLPWLASLALVATPFVWRLRLKSRRVGAFALALPAAAVVLLVAGIDHVELPALKGFNIRGGVAVPPELVALWAGLTIYATAFIAEIVRSSIQAVDKGQHEAARSLGLRPAYVLFLIVLPQALRIMVPQLTSQYLNLIKSSTLGAVVAYPDIFQIFAGTVMNHSGKEVETIIIVMAVFLTINLLFSAFMNWYNRRIALTER
jgi:general L-amino acid transport system permease protein